MSDEKSAKEIVADAVANARDVVHARAQVVRAAYRLRLPMRHGTPRTFVFNGNVPEFFRPNSLAAWYRPVTLEDERLDWDSDGSLDKDGCVPAKLLDPSAFYLRGLSVAGVSIIVSGSRVDLFTLCAGAAYLEMPTLAPSNTLGVTIEYTGADLMRVAPLERFVFGLTIGGYGASNVES